MEGAPRVRPGRAILGGSFNPPHVGHLRLAVEAREMLGARVEGVDLMPCSVPPHKDAAGLLPFDLRAGLVDACVAGVDGLACSRLEASRQGPSYTWDSLLALRAARPGARPWFILGSPDFAQVGSWRRGLDLPALCHMAVVPRGGHGVKDFMEMALALWPAATACPPDPPGCPRLALPGGGTAVFLPLPWLDVSSSRVRELWLRGRSVEFLVPGPALRLLRAHADAVRAHWGG